MRRPSPTFSYIQSKKKKTKITFSPNKKISFLQEKESEKSCWESQTAYHHSGLWCHPHLPDCRPKCQPKEPKSPPSLSLSPSPFSPLPRVRHRARDASHAFLSPVVSNLASHFAYIKSNKQWSASKNTTSDYSPKPAKAPLARETRWIQTREYIARKELELGLCLAPPMRAKDGTLFTASRAR